MVWNAKSVATVCRHNGDFAVCSRHGRFIRVLLGVMDDLWLLSVTKLLFTSFTANSTSSTSSTTNYWSICHRWLTVIDDVTATMTYIMSHAEYCCSQHQQRYHDDTHLFVTQHNTPTSSMHACLPDTARLSLYLLTLRYVMISYVHFIPLTRCSCRRRGLNWRQIKAVFSSSQY